MKGLPKRLLPPGERELVFSFTKPRRDKLSTCLKITLEAVREIEPLSQRLALRLGQLRATCEAARQIFGQGCQIERLVEVVGKQLELHNLIAQVSLLPTAEKPAQHDLEHVLANRRVGLFALREQLRIETLLAVARLALLCLLGRALFAFLAQVGEVPATDDGDHQSDDGQQDYLGPLEGAAIAVFGLAGHQPTRLKLLLTTRSRRSALSEIPTPKGAPFWPSRRTRISQPPAAGASSE